MSFAATRTLVTAPSANQLIFCVPDFLLGSSLTVTALAVTKRSPTSSCIFFAGIYSPSRRVEKTISKRGLNQPSPFLGDGLELRIAGKRDPPAFAVIQQLKTQRVAPDDQVGGPAGL